MRSDRAIFLDRDGTLVRAVVNRPDLPGKPVTAPFRMKELEFVPDLHESLAIMRESGAKLIIITNQPDVAHGYLTENEWERIHYKILGEVEPDDWMACRHRNEDGCRFRKPNPDMILAMADKWGVDLSRSFMVGDTISDTSAGKAAECKTVLIRWPYNEGISADFVVPSLLEAAKLVASQ